MERIFYIMGKSSSGKDSVYKELLSRLKLTPVTLYTTRPMRENELEGREYHFVDRAAFDKMCSAGSVLEYRIYNTVHGEWIYFTAKDSIDLSAGSCLGIGTLCSYVELKKYFGELLIPIYIEVEDGIRLTRALERERIEPNPRYAELCRRFLADSEDFSEEKLSEAGITKRFFNDSSFEECLNRIMAYISSLSEEADR